MRHLRKIILLVTLVASVAGRAQEDSTNVDTRPIIGDTLDWRYGHSPRKASILSAVLPGAGQVYNRKI